MACEAAGVAPPLEAWAHRWRYARVERPLGASYWAEKTSRLFWAGDGAFGGGVEGAWCSGERAAVQRARRRGQPRALCAPRPHAPVRLRRHGAPAEREEPTATVGPFRSDTAAQSSSQQNRNVDQSYQSRSSCKSYQAKRLWYSSNTRPQIRFTCLTWAGPPEGVDGEREL